MVEYNIDFLDEWDDLTDLEKKAIDALKQGLNIIMSNIPKEDILSIYLKGSFLRREMNPKSDVDVSIIVKEEKYLKTFQILNEKYRHSIKPDFEFGGYTLDELKTGNFSKYGKKMRAGTPRFVRHIPTYKLLYGEELDIENLYTKPDIKLFHGLIKAFENIFIPMYNKKQMGFQMILKQTLWLVELEASVNRKDFLFTSWKDLTNEFNSDHIINSVLELRERNEKDEKKKEGFLKQLELYISDLKTKYTN